MNNSPKFSINPLPGDDWETRYSKTIARNIARLKDDRGWTTAELAARCSQFMGTQDSVKVSALNGLFAGKRKSISVAEAHMFAAALGVPVLALIYPFNERLIEVGPSKNSTPLVAVLEAMGQVLQRAPFLDDDASKRLPLSQDTVTLDRIVEYWNAHNNLRSTIVDSAKAVEAKSEKDVDYRTAQLLAASMVFLHAHKALRERGIDPLPAPEGAEWVWDTPPNKINPDFVRAIVVPAFNQAWEAYARSLSITHEGGNGDGSPA